MEGRFRKELYNFAREADLSAWRSIAKYLMARLRKDDGQELHYIAESLAHFPNSRLSDRRIGQAFRLAKNLPRKTQASQSINLSYCLVLKPYISDVEKGIFLISFENQLDSIISSGLLPVVQARYHIVFIPSWTGLYSPALFMLATHAASEPVFVLPVHDREEAQVRRLGSGFIPLPFNAASWVNQDFFQQLEVERDIDCLMVANFSSFKRHWLLFKALKRLPKSVTATCVGVGLGSRHAGSVRQEAEDYGVSDRVTIIENPSQEDLRLYFQRAKTFCALSYREGSFIAVAEALMSGTPVVMFKNSHIGTKSLITPEVGALVGSVAELREQIMNYMGFENHARVRSIAADSISAQANCRKLNHMLSDWSCVTGRRWTTDIESFYSMRLNFYYFAGDAKKRLGRDFKYLKDQGITINLP